MSKMRIYELAKELDVTSKEIIELLKEFDFSVKNHMSVVEGEALDLVKEYYEEKLPNGEKSNVEDPDKKVESIDEDEELDKIVPIKKLKEVKNKNAGNKKQRKPKYNNEAVDDEKNENAAKANNVKSVELEDRLTVKQLAEKLGKPSADIIKKLILKGIMANINHELEFDVAKEIAAGYGIEVSKKEEKNFEEIVINDFQDKEEDLIPRPPVITIMGHVDHGKTSLLDAIRQTHVTNQEAGGITQHIGAYTVHVRGEKITFLDTPGHEAFTSMRARGAQATDIAVLVVAADDGVMPQTIEAINHAKAANVPIVVAINKIDKPTANPDRVMQELTEYELVPESWGGGTICVPVSAKTKEGIDNLLEMLLLVAEMRELKANPNRLANGIVIESRLDKGLGPVASVLVKNGTLKIGDSIIAGTNYGRVRAMFDDKGKKIKSAGPSIPVEVLGFNEVPDAGDIVYAVQDEKSARQVAEKRIAENRNKMIVEPHTVSLEGLFSQIQEGKIKELNIIVKADVHGSVEALKQSLEKMSNEDVKVRVIHGGVGAITETDVSLASASNAVIIGFNVRPDTNARIIAEKENVDIKTYRVIYEAIDAIQSAMNGMLEPEYKEVIHGRAEVRQTFKASSVGTIAGCYVTEGKITRNSDVRVIRDGIVIYEGELASLKRFKDDAKEVLSGFECGLNIEKYNDIKEGDIIEAFGQEQISRTI